MISPEINICLQGFGLAFSPLRLTHLQVKAHTYAAMDFHLNANVVIHVGHKKYDSSKMCKKNEKQNNDTQCCQVDIFGSYE